MYLGNISDVKKMNPKVDGTNISHLSHQTPKSNQVVMVPIPYKPNNLLSAHQANQFVQAYYIESTNEQS